MEDYVTPDNNDNFDNFPEQREELSHADKLSGMITSPGQTFSEMSLHKPKSIDWILPILVLIVVSILSNYVMMNVPTVKGKIMEKQIEMMKENFDHQVEIEAMTAEEAEKQFNNIVDKMQDGNAGIGIFGSGVSIVIIVFLFFFLVSLVLFIFARFIFKDQGTYSHALVAYGLPSYITAFQVIITTLITILSGELINGTSLNTIVGADPISLNGFLMSKIDPIRIWYYAVISIAFAKMFRAENTTKYYITIFGLWIGFGLLILLLSQHMPWLGRFLM